MAVLKIFIFAALIAATLAPSTVKAQEDFTPPAGCDSPASVEPGQRIQCRCLPASLKQRRIEDEPQPPYSSQRTSGIVFPVYPAEAKAKKLRGKVYLSLGVDTTGRVTDATIIKGPKIFRRVAVEAACMIWLTPRQVLEHKQWVEAGKFDWTITFVP